MFNRSKRKPPVVESDRFSGFEYLGADDHYLDAACQALRPVPVQEAIQQYFTDYNACGGRVRYAWGRKIDDRVDETRNAVLNLLRLSHHEYVAAFTLNTTYAINLLLQQLPAGMFRRIVTSQIEHNSVFLPTITSAERLGIERLVLDRTETGALEYSPDQLDGAVVVVNMTSNIDGRCLVNAKELIADTHKAGGVVILDAAQSMAHHHDLLERTEADAVCFSGHKMYAGSLGVTVAKRSLVAMLNPFIIGGGTVLDVTESAYELDREHPEAVLEPGLQAWAEIVSLGAALRWLDQNRRDAAAHMQQLTNQLWTGLNDIDGINLVNKAASPVVSLFTPGIDSHRLATFLSTAGVMVRSGYFCAHNELIARRHLPPLVRLSIGLHNNSNDITVATDTLKKLVKGMG